MELRQRHREPSLTRRGFGRLSLAAAVAATGAVASRSTAEEAVLGAEGLTLAAGPGVPVALAGVARGSEEAETVRAVRDAVSGATDLSWLSRGDTVLIKVSCNSGNVYPATTDPVALRAMIGLLREQGAGRVIVAEDAEEATRYGIVKPLRSHNPLVVAYHGFGGLFADFRRDGLRPDRWVRRAINPPGWSPGGDHQRSEEIRAAWLARQATGNDEADMQDTSAPDAFRIAAE